MVFSWHGSGRMKPGLCVQRCWHSAWRAVRVHKHAPHHYDVSAVRGAFRLKRYKSQPADTDLCSHRPQSPVTVPASPWLVALASDLFPGHHVLSLCSRRPIGSVHPSWLDPTLVTAALSRIYSYICFLAFFFS